MIRISAFMFLLFSTFGVMTFFLSLYMQHRGLTPGQIGVIMSGGALVSMIGQPFWGYISDRNKTVKRVILLLIGLSFASAMAMFSASGMLPILLLYALFMFFNSSMGPLAETLCISYTFQQRIDYGRIRMWGELGVGTATLMLGFLMQRVGIDYLWVVYASMLLVASLAAVNVRDSEATPVPVDLAALRKLFAEPRLLWFLFIVLLIAIPHKMNDSMLALYLSELGGKESQLGLAWLVATASSAAMLLFVDRLMRGRNELLFLTTAALFYILRWFLYSRAHSPELLIAAQALHALTFSFFFVSSIRYMRHIIPPHLMASGQAAFAVTFGGFGGIIGNAGGGYIIDRAGMSEAYALGCLLALAGGAAAIATYLYNRRRGIAQVQPETAAAQVKTGG